MPNDRVEWEDAFIAVGSNLGDREALLVSVLAEVRLIPATQLVAVSSVFETDPVGPGDQGRYLNAAFAVRTGQSPIDLLRALQAIEAKLGRDRSERAVRWGARTVDLDLLFWGDRMIALPDLVVPHPRLHERAFVLAPLVEIAADVVHPVLGHTVAQLWDALAHDESVVRAVSPAGWSVEGQRAGGEAEADVREG